MKPGIPISYYALYAEFQNKEIVDNMEVYNGFRLFIYNPYSHHNESDFILAASDLKKESDWIIHRHNVNEEIWQFWFASVLHHLKMPVGFHHLYLNPSDMYGISSIIEQDYTQFKEIERFKDPFIDIQFNGQIIDYSFANLNLFYLPTGDFQTILSGMVKNHRQYLNKLQIKQKKEFFSILDMRCS